MMRFILLLSIIFVLPACARVELASHAIKQFPISERHKPVGKFKVGNPYRVAGRTYVPQESYTLAQEGIASWYGPKFHGKMTANGEIYDKFELTAAHKTLQMPSLVRVTNLENGRSVIVRINDRGPFAKNRIIDVSERAAELLDFKHKGTAKVRIEVLDKESRRLTQMAQAGHDTRGTEVVYNQRKPSFAEQPEQIARKAPLTSPVTPRYAAASNNLGAGRIFVQAGSFGNENNAYALARQLSTYGDARIYPTSINGSPLYRVRFGPLASATQADYLVSQLASANISTPIIVEE